MALKVSGLASATVMGSAATKSISFESFRSLLLRPPLPRRSLSSPLSSSIGANSAAIGNSSRLAARRWLGSLVNVLISPELPCLPFSEVSLVPILLVLVPDLMLYAPGPPMTVAFKFTLLSSWRWSGTTVSDESSLLAALACDDDVPLVVSCVFCGPTERELFSLSS